MFCSDSGIEDEREPDKKEENKESEEPTNTECLEKKPTEDENEGDEAEEEENEKCYLCPCWSFCPGVGILPPDTPNERTILNFIKLVLSWVGVFIHQIIIRYLII